MFFKPPPLSAKKLRKIIDSGSEGIWVVDQHGITTFTNPALNTMLGYGAKEMLGRSSFDFFLFDDSTSFEPFAISMDKGKIDRYEIKLLRKNRTHCWAMLGSSPILDEKGEKKGSIFMLTDITDRKINEKVIADQNAKITHHAQLSALGEMAAGIAHEINTPLSTIVGKISLLKLKAAQKGSFSAEELLPFLETIEETAFRIARIIKGMRAVSRTADGLPFQLVALQSVISEAMLLCAESLKSSNLHFEVVGDPELMVECQPIQISQVLFNLVKNAYDAIVHSPDPWIRIESSQTDEFVKLSVTDSGKGIPKDIAKRIMEPFFTTKEVGKGTGLGLSVSANILKEHGGTLTLNENCPNTQFVISFPKRRQGNQPKNETNAAKSAA